MRAWLALLVLVGLAQGALAQDKPAPDGGGADRFDQDRRALEQIIQAQVPHDSDRLDRAGKPEIGNARVGKEADAKGVTPGAAPGGVVTVHVGNHGSFGRVVFNLPASVAIPGVPASRRDGDSLIIDLPGAGTVRVGAQVTARRVLGVQGGQGQARLMLQPGSTIRIWRMMSRIVVDVFADAPVADGKIAAGTGGAAAGKADVKMGAAAQAPAGAGKAAALPPAKGIAAGAAGAASGSAGARAAQAGQPGGAAQNGQTAALSPSPERPAKPAAHGAGAPVPPPMEAASATDDVPQATPAPAPEGSEALRAVRLAGQGDTILLPFDRRVGAAAFSAGGLGHAVFDDSKAIDLSALKEDPVFASARIMVSAGSTHLSMVVPKGARLSLARREAGWALSVQGPQAARPGAPVRLHDETLNIAMKAAADVVVLLDPVTGAKLLVGTVREHGDGVIIGHVSPEFALLASWEGVAVRVVSDRLSLKATRDGFALSAASGPTLSTLMLDSTQAGLESAGTLTRRFDIPSLSLAALRRRLLADITVAGHAPRLARFKPRLAAAQDMLGLGMDREAAALLGAARNDDPSQEARPDAVALQAIARWLAGLTEQNGDAPGPGVEAIDNPGLGVSDEVALWRALLPARGVASPLAASAAVLAADWRLLTSYPATLRRRVVPQAASIMIEGNALHAAGELLDASADLPVGLERAHLLAAQGKTGEALAAMDALVRGADRKEAGMALRDATELRLAGHLMTPLAAAKVLDHQLYAWRDPEFELERRLRIGALLTQGGAFRQALTGLREADAVFPKAHERIRAGEADAIGALVHDGRGAALAPIDLVALVDDNADLLGQGDVAASLTPLLVDKLIALDLPNRADRLVAKLIASTEGAVPKAVLGAKLAGLRLDQNDPPGALAALDQTMGDALPPEVEGRRAVARARALSELGEDGPALSLLAGQEGVESWQVQAQLREKSRDWHGADAVLQKLVQASVPASGALNAAQQDLVLRLASVASQAGDNATLRALADGAARRLSPGPRASLFEALTVQPVRELADLPRAQREAAAAAALPAAWKGYTGH